MTRFGLVSALVLASLCLGADAFVYERTVTMGGDTTGYLFSDGPMYLGESGGKQSTLHVSGSLTSTTGVPLASRGVVVTVAFVDEMSRSQVGWPYPGLAATNKDTALCCTEALHQSGVCGVSTPGELIVRKPSGNGLAPQVSVIQAPPSGPLEIDTGVTTRTSGQQWIVVSACSSSGATVPESQLAATLSFKNPYGFLPGWRYGYMGYFGAIGSAYALFAAVFAVVMLLRRQHALHLQGSLALLALLGAVEMGVLFGTFVAHNESGVPLCCPTKPEVVAAAVLTAAKWAASQGLLLAICLGYGVVVPALPRRHTVALVALSVLYFGAAVYSNVAQLDATELSAPLLPLIPAVLLNAVFLAWTIGALQAVRRQLHESGQAVKLAMYDRLATALFAAVALIVAVTVLTAGVGLGLLALPWQWTFLFTNQWDIIYVGVLLAVGAIWFPGERSARYAFYEQAALEDDAASDGGADTGLGVEDDEDGAAGGGEVELAATEGRPPERSDAFAVAGSEDGEEAVGDEHPSGLAERGQASAVA